jgi:hypothetical protein
MIRSNFTFNLLNGTERGTRVLELRSGSNILLGQRTLYPSDDVAEAKVDLLRHEILGERYTELLPLVQAAAAAHPTYTVAQTVLMAKKVQLGLVCARSRQGSSSAHRAASFACPTSTATSWSLISQTGSTSLKSAWSDWSRNERRVPLLLSGC